MTTLNEIAAKIKKNNQKYQKTEEIEFLLANIKLFEKFEKELTGALAKKSQDELYEYNKDLLFVIAKNYIQYAHTQKTKKIKKGL